VELWFWKYDFDKLPLIFEKTRIEGVELRESLGKCMQEDIAEGKRD